MEKRRIAKTIIMIAFSCLFCLYPTRSISAHAEQYVYAKSEKEVFQKASKALKKADYDTVFVCDQNKFNRYLRFFVTALEQSPYRYGTGYSYMNIGGSGYFWYVSYYGTPKSVIQYKIKSANKKAKSVAKRIMSNHYSKYDRIKAAHDWLCENCVYEYGDPDENSDKFTAYGALINHRAVCAGYSAAMDLILSYMSIKSITVSGGGHAWNLISYNGKALHTDVTWDDGDGYGTGYTYFMRSTGYFRDTHEWDSSRYGKKYLKWQ